jgi:hypothetical protein
MDEKEYSEKALAFLSEEYHQNEIEPFNLEYMFRHGIITANHVDRVKKALFYGKRFNGKEYPNMKTSIEHDPKLNNLMHAVLGLYTEIGEIFEHLYDIMSKRCDTDFVNFTEEVGDIYWYLNLLQVSLNLSSNEIREKNIAKLSARYGEKFHRNRALYRDLKAERKVLEK